MSNISFELRKFSDKNPLLIGILAIAVVLVSAFIVSQGYPTGAAAPFKYEEPVGALVLNLAPHAVLTAGQTSGPAPLSIYFKGNESYDTDGSITSYSWDFGDRGTSISPNPVHVYPYSGNYTVSLTVTDNSGAEDSTFKKIEVR